MHCIGQKVPESVYALVLLFFVVEKLSLEVQNIVLNIDNKICDCIILSVMSYTPGVIAARNELRPKFQVGTYVRPLFLL